MIIVSINTCNYGSTGNIMLQIMDACSKSGITTYTAYRNSRSNRTKKVDNSILIGNRITNNISLKADYYYGGQGYHNVIATKQLIKKILKINPDIIHLHNLHEGTINLKIFFDFIKRNNYRIVWTLHDCWSFTGRCPHFSVNKCNNWKNGCSKCTYPKREYPSVFINKTEKTWMDKKQWFSGINNLTIVTPSRWLCNLVKESFLQGYQIRTIYNGIDLSVFKPSISNFKSLYNIDESKKIVLGIAFGWSNKKGLDVFIELSKRLNPDDYQIVLVGIDKKTREILPNSIISIDRIQSKDEMVNAYNSADVFVNPTREEVLGMVNIEANACGIPVITFDTGGSPECISPNSGSVVEYDNIDAMQKEIIRVCEEKPYNIIDCVLNAKRFDINERINDYINLYEEINA